MINFKVTIVNKGINFIEYPFLSALVYPHGLLLFSDIEEYIENFVPPVILTKKQEILFIPATMKEQLKLLCIGKNISVVLREDKRAITKTGATAYMILLSAAIVTLNKYSRQEDIVIGSQISARTHKDTEKMLGMFVNTLALRGRPEGKKGFMDFLEEVKEMCIRSYENQEYPFEELVKAVNINRDMARTPLFDIMLVLQNNEEVRYELKEIEIEYINTGNNILKCDLTFNIYEYDELAVELEYCMALYREESARRILDNYIKILEQITEKTESKIDEL